MLLTYETVGDIERLMHSVAPVFVSKGEGVLPGAVDNMRQGGQKTVKDHRVDSTCDPPWPVSFATVIGENHRNEQLHDVIAHCDQTYTHTNHTYNTYTILAI